MAQASEVAPAPPPDPRLAPIEALLKTIGADQKNILTALGLVLDGLTSQTTLLKELTSMAKDDPGPSPLADSLERLADVVLGMHGGLKTLSQRLDSLPAAIRIELERPSTPAEG